MSHTYQRSFRGFTLIEMLVVMTIIALLAGLVVGSMGYVQEKQARETAKTQIALLSKAIEDYKTELGVYPGATADYGGGTASTSAGLHSRVLYQALFFEGYEFSADPNRSDTNNTKARKIYLTQLDPRNNKQGWVTSTAASLPTANLQILDPWGNEYRYRLGSNAQNPDFDLWSAGKDGQTNVTLDHDENKDDIRNF